VTWNFSQQGIISVDMESDDDPDAIGLQAIDAGAEDVVDEDGLLEVITVPRETDKVRQALEDAGVHVSAAEVQWRAGSMVELDESKARSLLKLIDSLEDLDDVQHVASNADIPEAAFAEVET
jgi:transcriptional/translational regulatory protein YebC/TACO1